MPKQVDQVNQERHRDKRETNRQGGIKEQNVGALKVGLRGMKASVASALSLRFRIHRLEAYATDCIVFHGQRQLNCEVSGELVAP
jgi:hypothetical protein